MDKPKLEPCPICGGDLKIHGPEDWTPSFYDPDSGGDPYRAQCDCGFSFDSCTYDYEDFVTALNRRALPADKSLTVEPCWCKDCTHAIREDGLNYACGNPDSTHYEEAVQPHCTCEECVRVALAPDYKCRDWVSQPTEEETIDCKIGQELFFSDKKNSVILRVIPHSSDSTRADCIRSMSDEELAAWIIYLQEHEMSEKWCRSAECFRRVDAQEEFRCTDEMLGACVARWLGQPAEES